MSDKTPAEKVADSFKGAVGYPGLKKIGKKIKGWLKAMFD